MHYGLGTVTLTSTGCYQIRDEGKMEGMREWERKRETKTWTISWFLLPHCNVKTAVVDEKKWDEEHNNIKCLAYEKKKETQILIYESQTWFGNKTVEGTQNWWITVNSWSLDSSSCPFDRFRGFISNYCSDWLSVSVIKQPWLISDHTKRTERKGQRENPTVTHLERTAGWRETNERAEITPRQIRWHK